MNSRSIRILLTVLLGSVFLGYGLLADQDNEEYVMHTFEKIHLSSTFYAEGAGIGDLNDNGQNDVICGPYWYEGPDFDHRQAYYEPHEFDPLGYSDNFIVEVDDVTGNGRNDILVIGFPGQEAYWHENTGEHQQHWPRHLIYSQVDNESPGFADVTGDGNLEMVFHTDGYVGYASPDSEDPTKPWVFTPVSEQKELGHFAHGFGVGDITGNGHKDFILARGWLENPGADWDGQTPWHFHPEDFGPGGAQMFAYDQDGDGLNDVITSQEAHGWGLTWYRQVRNGDEIDFEKNLIMGSSNEDNPYGVRFSQPHAVALADMNNNGTKGILSGKRWWAHGPEGDPEPNAAAVIYWFEPNQTDDGDIEFIPYLVDDDSGVGVEIAVGDVSGNGYPDIVTCNKKGGFVFLNQPQTVTREEWEAVQPTLLQKETEQVEIFNEIDLQGWHGDMEYWRAEDGMIIGEFTEMPATQFLHHEQVVEDFRLIFNVRTVDGLGNSGIQYRSEALPNGQVRGPQADIGDGYWGKLYEEFGRTWLWEDETCDQQHVDKEGWNLYELLAVDSLTKIAINGHVCMEYDDPLITRKGILALQLHAGFAPAEIQFKDFELVLNPKESDLITVN